MPYSSIRLGVLVAALSAAALLAGGSAKAADLGGDCCADLEERVAELEATTVRKGNKKVSVTISGWVVKTVNWWDDGVESNVYVGDKGTELSSHFQISGSATISPGWSSGYTLDVEAPGTTFGFAANQFNDNTNDGLGVIRTHLSYMWLKSDKVGTLSWGLLHQATDNLAILVDLSGTVIESDAIFLEGDSFFLRAKNGLKNSQGLLPAQWFNFLFCDMATAGGSAGADCNAVPANGVLYQSPTFGGFSVTGGHYEDDIWDIALKYNADWNSIKVSAAAGYTEATDEQFIFGGGGRPFQGYRMDDSYVQAAASVLHVPSGLFFNAQWWRENVGGKGNKPFGVSSAAQESDVVFLKTGIRKAWSPVGATVLWGEWGLYDDQFADLANLNVCAAGGAFNGSGIGFGAAPVCNANPTVFVTDSEVTRWGLGVMQEIDSAAMHIFTRWQHQELDVGLVNGLGARVNQSFEDWDLIQAGGIIFF